MRLSGVGTTREDKAALDRAYRGRREPGAGWMSRAEQRRSETPGWLSVDAICLRHREEETELPEEGRLKS